MLKSTLDSEYLSFFPNVPFLFHDPIGHFVITCPQAPLGCDHFSALSPVTHLGHRKAPETEVLITGGLGGTQRLGLGTEWGPGTRAR